jgi:2-polyprenyl-3-methyl-5-hydroxy-6-metoxy-1,4-benzoquinol methylase
MSFKHLEAIRLLELDYLLDEIKSAKLRSNVILEIGSGSGLQAKRLAEKGYDVKAIDIADSIYSEQRIWPILNYDGKHIPFSDDHFDIVFSSSVLEHIPHADEFQREIRRVLKADGIAIHIVPSASWRFWTNVAHYPFVIKAMVKMICTKTVVAADAKNYNEVEILALNQMRQLSAIEVIKKAIFPPRHGEAGNAITELYSFSRRSWFKLFTRAGWKIEKAVPNRLFYTGHMILSSALSVQVRRFLSYVLGSSCHIFKLRK